MADNLTIELEGFKKLSKQYNPSAVRRGTNSAINKTQRKGRTKGTKKTREKYNIRASALKKQIKVRRSKPSTLEATITIKGRPFNVGKYSGTRQTAKGVTYSVVRGQKKTVTGAFLVHVDDLGNGRGKPTTRTNIYPKQRKVFRQKARSGKKLAFKRVGANRYPINEVLDLSAVEMFEDTGLDTIEDIIDKELDDLIMREVEFFQDKLG